MDLFVRHKDSGLSLAQVNALKLPSAIKWQVSRRLDGALSRGGGWRVVNGWYTSQVTQNRPERLLTMRDKTISVSCFRWNKFHASRPEGIIQPSSLPMQQLLAYECHVWFANCDCTYKRLSTRYSTKTNKNSTIGLIYRPTSNRLIKWN